MAMNKKEKEALEEAQRAASVNRALRWSDYDSEPDLSTSDIGDGYVNGWSFNQHGLRVYKSWSSSIAHGEGWAVDGKRPGYASQRSIPQYSTKERALKALRRKVEQDFAEKLAAIDSHIKSEAAE